MNAPDVSLASQLAETLDHAQTRLDPAVTERLRQIRQQALAQRSVMARTSAWPAYGYRQWSVYAATVALCALMLGVSHHLLPQGKRTDILASQPKAQVQEYWMEDPQMLADWELLDVIGEDPDAS